MAVVVVGWRGGEINKARVEGCCRVEDEKKRQVFVSVLFLCVVCLCCFLRPCVAAFLRGGRFSRHTLLDSLCSVFKCIYCCNTASIGF